MKRFSRRLAGITLLATSFVAMASAHAEGPASGVWNFNVLLDGKSIGRHRFTLTTEGEQRRLKSEASFDVKLLGINVYRYRHDDTELWKGDCLVSMSAQTDDGGKATSVKAKLDGDALAVQSAHTNGRLEGCVLSFAYWNPAMLKQTRLLNAQTGRYENVKIEPLGDAKVQSQGKSVEARHYRLTGPEQPIDLWYAPDGDWLALASMVSGGKRKLEYVRE